MKKYILILLLPLFTSWGCSDVIDVTPEDATTFTNYFKSLRDADALQVTMYGAMREFMEKVNNHIFMGDYHDNYLPSNQVYDLWSLAPDKHVCNWAEVYQVIFDADLIIDNAHRFPSQDSIRPYMLDACFIKAFCYFRLAQDWGNVPIRVNSTSFDKVGQSPATEVLDYAAGFAKRALDLPVYGQLYDGHGAPRTSKMFATKGVAAALLAQIYAWRAGLSGSAEDWAEAEKYCSMIINGEVGNYNLLPDPETLCVEGFHRDSEESIWEWYYTYGETKSRMNYVGVSTSMNYFPVNSLAVPVLNYEVGSMNRSTVQKWYAKGDRRREAFFWAVDADSLYVIRDTVSKNSYSVCVTHLESGKVKYEAWNSDIHASDTLASLLSSKNEIVENSYDIRTDPNMRRVYPVKTWRWPNYQLDKRGNLFMANFESNRVYWRLADIILLRAECRVRQNDRNGAIADLNRIRERACGNKNQNYPCEHDRLQGLDRDLQRAIFREREKELIFENHRWFDIVRNGNDYIRRELPMGYQTLTDQDIADGAMYYAVYSQSFRNNDLIRQNRFWNKRMQ